VVNLAYTSKVETMTDNGKEPAPVLTVREAARELGVHPQTVYRQVAAGTLPHFRVGQAIRFRRADLLELRGERKAA
jgi:excisionase family DNA binding protein